MGHCRFFHSQTRPACVCPTLPFHFRAVSTLQTASVAFERGVLSRTLHSTVSTIAVLRITDLGSSPGIFSVTLQQRHLHYVNGNSYIDIGNSEVKFNNLGIGFDLFGKGVLRQVDVSSNTSNTQTSRGGEFFSEP